MGTSDSTQIPSIFKLVAEVNPKSILDVGVGRGRYGALFRLTFETDNPHISDRSSWAVRIDGVEAFPEGIGEIQNSIYDRIIGQPIQQVVDDLGEYDVILMADVIEHLEKEEGLAVLRKLVTRAKARLIVATPNGYYEQDEMYGNEFERHLSAWDPKDFLEFPNREIYVTSKAIIAVLGSAPLPQVGRRWGIDAFRRYPMAERVSAWVRYRKNRLLGKPKKFC